jgi:Bacteriophage Mu Gam like protein
MTTTELGSQLDDYLEMVEQPPDQDREGPWRITDDGAADWALRKLARARARQQEVDNLLKDRMDHLRAWHRDASEPLDREVAHWTALLEAYALERREQTGAASVRLPNGELVTRKVNRAVEITDARALLAWLDDQPTELLDRWCKLDPTPQISRLKADVAITSAGVTYEGEVVPGLSVRPEAVKPDVRT